MKYPVGKLLTREYSDIERRILQARLIRRTDSWNEEVIFICKTGRYGRRKVNEQEIWDISDLVTRVRISPYIEYLFMLEKYARIMQIMMPGKMPTTGKSSASLLDKYKWLYDTE